MLNKRIKFSIYGFLIGLLLDVVAVAGFLIISVIVSLSIQESQKLEKQFNDFSNIFIWVCVIVIPLLTTVAGYRKAARLNVPTPPK